jgi:hypothetical protein
VFLFGGVESFLRLGDSRIPAVALLGPRLLFPTLGGFPLSLLLFEVAAASRAFELLVRDDVASRGFAIC